MSKILFYSDVHWNTTTSIVRQSGNKFSLRLEYLIKSMNWVNEQAKNCIATFCLGDFFDKAQITDEEATALQDINWAAVPHYFICGNHESSVLNLNFSTLKCLEAENRIIITTPTSVSIDNIIFDCLPYITDANRQAVSSYFDKSDSNRTILLSHIDIADINYGGFTSIAGFSKEELNSFAKYTFNGHLHNSSWVSEKILNVGSLSAHNFTNDSARYSYGIWLFDTETYKVDFIENPYSFNFYKLQINSEAEIKKLNILKDNAVISVTCPKELQQTVAAAIEQINSKIIASRIMLSIEKGTEETSIVELTGTDHIQKFIDFCHEKIGSSSIIDSELAEVCK